MDQVIINQLQFYTPPTVIKKLFENQRICLSISKYIIDKEFKHKPQKWKTIAFPEYEDFFQAALSGFNPYKKDKTTAKDKGLLQAIQTYNPYKSYSPESEDLLLTTIGDIEQAVCPCCNKRGEIISLWPYSGGNKTVDSEHAPDPMFSKGDKYCGKEIIELDKEQLNKWLELNLIRKNGDKYFCNHINRLASIKNYISSQIGFLIQDIRTAEYHSSRSLRRHPFYPCPACGVLNPDFNTTTSKTLLIECSQCKVSFNLKDVKTSKIVWQARGATNVISFSDHANDTDGRSCYDEIIANYAPQGSATDPSIYHGTIQEEKDELFTQLIDRIRELSVKSLSKKQYSKLVNDPSIVKINGIPETQNFKIFYEYFFIDDVNQKQQHTGKIKNNGDESSTYKELALKYLKKEQHYTRCLDCNLKMYEPTESGKFKKLGISNKCTHCSSINIVYHGPKCGQPGSCNPNCKEHPDVEIVMYIFQTIEPKIRRLEELVRNDKQAKEIYERIQELLMAKDELESFQDMVKLLNY